jgi:hypothetical protein
LIGVREPFPELTQGLDRNDFHEAKR